MCDNPYDKLYSQIDVTLKPFGYDPDYILWRQAKLKNELAKFINGYGKILDVGGGYGIMTQFLPDFVDQENYYNLDISIVMLKQSRYQNILAAGEAIPVCDNSFDHVISSEALEHATNTIKTLSECYRVLKPGGLFLLSTPRQGWIEDFMRSPFLPFIIMDRLLNRFFPKKQEFQTLDGTKDDSFDEDWLRTTLEKIGFEVIEQYRADNHVAWRKFGESKFWRWFADRFVDPKRYGHCTIVICRK